MVRSKIANLKNKYLLFIGILILLSVILFLSGLFFFRIISKNPLKSASNIYSKIEKVNNLNIDSIFNPIPADQVIKEKANPGEYTIIATGDVIPARSVNFRMVTLNNFNYPFEKTKTLLKSADITLINLESPLTLGCQPTTEGMVFCGDQRFAQFMSQAGVRVANLANNHSANYGNDGVIQTIELLSKNNIKSEGFGEPAVLSVKDKKFGFLGYNDVGINPPVASADAGLISSDIRKLKKQVDFVIVSFHWGVEYTSTPSARQIEIAHQAIDAGADLIIGNHPHWPQGVEVYKGKLITYAHGNFIFDQMWSQETREGVVGKYTFNNQGLTKVEFIPIIIEDYAQPRFASDQEAKNILAKMKFSTDEIRKIVNN